jgi:hypothetical protein
MLDLDLRTSTLEQIIPALDSLLPVRPSKSMLPFGTQALALSLYEGVPAPRAGGPDHLGSRGIGVVQVVPGVTTLGEIPLLVLLYIFVVRRNRVVTVFVFEVDGLPPLIRLTPWLRV